MDGFRVFLRGQLSIDHAVTAISALRPIDVLDGPIGPVDVLCVRGDVLVELCRRHAETDRFGRCASDFPLLTRFVSTRRQAHSAWVAAHAFLWMVTRRPNITEALLVGPETEPLRFREGRIRPMGVPQQRPTKES